MLSIFVLAVSVTLPSISPELWVAFMSAIGASLITQVVRKIFPGIADQLATTINQALATFVTMAAWYFFGGADPATMSEWFLWSQAAGGAGTTGFNLFKFLAKRIAAGR